MHFNQCHYLFFPSGGKAFATWCMIWHHTCFSTWGGIIRPGYAVISKGSTAALPSEEIHFCFSTFEGNNFVTHFHPHKRAISWKIYTFLKCLNFQHVRLTGHIFKSKTSLGHKSHLPKDPAWLPTCCQKAEALMSGLRSQSANFLEAGSARLMVGQEINKMHTQSYNSWRSKLWRWFAR